MEVWSRWLRIVSTTSVFDFVVLCISQALKSTLSKVSQFSLSYCGFIRDRMFHLTSATSYVRETNYLGSSVSGVSTANCLWDSMSQGKVAVAELACLLCTVASHL